MQLYTKQNFGMDTRFLKVLCIILCIYLFIQFIALWTINTGQDDGNSRKNKHYVVTSILNEMQIFCVGYRPRLSNSGSNDLALSHPMNFNILPTPNLPGTSATASAEINSNAASAEAAGPDLGLNHTESQRWHNEKTHIPQTQEVQPGIISQDGAPTTNRLNNTVSGSQCTEYASAYPIVNNTRLADKKVTENARSVIQMPQDLFEDMYKDEMCEEKVRLATFKFWPRPSPSPAQMAMAGFYYTPENLSFREESTTNESLWIDDTVFCFCCGISMREWKQGDSPVQEHHRNSPHCNFIRQLLAEDNIDCPLALPSSVEVSGEVASRSGVRCVPFFCFNYTECELVTSGFGAIQYRNATTSQTSRQEITRTNERISATGSRRNRIDRILDSIVGRRVIEEGFSRARVAEAVDSLIAGNPHFEVSYDLLKATLISMRASRHQRRPGEGRDRASGDLEVDDE